MVLGLQHVFVISVGWIFAVVLVTAIGGTAAQAQAIIRASMVASGIATILQARVAGRVGSGYMCPFSCGPAYLSASILAGRTSRMAYCSKSLLPSSTNWTNLFQSTSCPSIGGCAVTIAHIIQFDFSGNRVDQDLLTVA